MMNEGHRPRVSILMGIYNCAATLPDAIESLYAQTFKDFVLILCDDGSTDGTYQVAEQYCRKYKNIILLKNSVNLKLAATLNRCLEHANTEYVARMDGDDLSLPERLEKQVKFLDEHPEFALVSCQMIYFDETGDWGVSSLEAEPNKETFIKTSPHAHAPCMMRTNILRELGGYTVSKLTERGQDYHLWYKFYKAGYRGYNMQEALYKMRDDRAAMRRRSFRDRYLGFLRKIHILRGLGISNPVWHALPALLKAFVPIALAEQIRKRKMPIK